MHFEILHIEGCPGLATATERLRTALEATGHADAPVGIRMLRTEADARNTAFAGSPTITLDGVDLFPSGTASSALACRLYPTPFGLAGSPTVEQFVERIPADV